MRRGWTSGVPLRIVSRDGPGDSQRRPSADRNSPAGGSLIRTDGLEGAVLGGGMTRVSSGDHPERTRPEPVRERPPGWCALPSARTG